MVICARLNTARGDRIVAKKITFFAPLTHVAVLTNFKDLKLH